jgi:predicted PurR-regulated permease PerM
MAEGKSQAGKDWRSSHLWQIQPIRDGVLLAAVLGLIWLGYHLSVVTVPMLLALAFAYLCEPLVRRLTATKLFTRKGIAVGLIFAALVVVILPVSLGLGFAAVQGARFAQSIARNVDKTVQSIRAPGDEGKRAGLMRNGMPTAWLSIRDSIVEIEEEAKRRRDSEQKERVVPEAGADAVPQPAGEAGAANEPADVKADAGGVVGADGGDGTAAVGPPMEEDHVSVVGPSVPSAALSDLYDVGMWGLEWVNRNAGAIGKQAINVGGGAVGAAVGAASSIFGVIFGGFLTGFFFFFFCTGYGKVLDFWEGLIPERKKGKVIDLVQQMDAVIAGFVRGRLTICAVLILYYILAYWAIGVPAPLVVGLVVGALTLVPYAAGATVPVVMLLMWIGGGGDDGVGSKWWWIVGAPLVVLAIQQVMDDYVLTPRVQGKSTNMDTPTILFASIAGGVLAGFYGLLLAIPVAACIKIVMKEIVWPRVNQWLAGRVADPLPFEHS